MLVWWQQATHGFWSKCVQSTREHSTVEILLAAILAPTIVALAIAAGMALYPQLIFTGA